MNSSPPSHAEAASTSPRVRGVEWIWAALFAAPFAAFLVFSIRLAAFPHVWENGEGVVMADVQALARGVSPYRDLRAYPFTVCNYPPVYHALCAAGMALTGPRSFLPGRAISLAAFLAIGWAIGSIVYRETKRAGLACAAAMTPFSIDCIAALGPVCRVDAAAAAFSLLGVAAAHRRIGSNRWAAPAAWFLLAGFTKHSAAAGALAWSVFLLAAERRKAARAVPALAGLALLGVAALQLLTHGLFLKNIFEFTWTRWDGESMWRYVRGFLRRGGAAFAIGALCFALGALRDLHASARSRGQALLLLYLGCNAAALVQLGKVGVSYLYLIEFAAAACLASALFVGRVTARRPNRRLREAVVLTGVTAIAAAQVLFQLDPLRGRLKRLDGRVAARWEKLLSQANGPVLAEDPGYLISAGKRVVVNPFILSQLGARTRFELVKTDSKARRAEMRNAADETVAAAHDRVLADIRAGRFAFVQTSTLLNFRMYAGLPPRIWASGRRLTDERFSPAWQRAIEERYALVQCVGLGGLYAPRGAH